MRNRHPSLRMWTAICALALPMTSNALAQSCFSAPPSPPTVVSDAYVRVPLGSSACSTNTYSSGETPAEAWGDHGKNNHNWTADRRPVYVIQLAGGSPNLVDECNPYRFRASFLPEDMDQDTNGNQIPDPFDWLISELDTAKSMGYRRVMLWLPGGNILDAPQQGGCPECKPKIPGHHLLGFSMLHALPQSMVSAWETYIGGQNGWIAQNPAVSVGMYTGSWLNELATPCINPEAGYHNNYFFPDPCDNQHCHDPQYDVYDCSHINIKDSRVPDPNNCDDMNLLKTLLSAWLDIGFSEIWFDKSSDPDIDEYNSATPPRNVLTQLQFNPDYAGVHLGGEAFPWNDYGTRHLDWEAAWVSPWTSAQTTLEGRTNSNPLGDGQFDEMDLTDKMILKQMYGFDNQDLLDQWRVEETELFVWYTKDTIGNIEITSREILLDHRDRGFLPMVQGGQNAAVRTTELYDGDDNGFFVWRTPESPTGNQLHRADFNGDGVVDCSDACDFWGRWLELNYSCASGSSILPDHVDPAYADCDMNNDDCIDGADVTTFSDWYNQVHGTGAFWSCISGAGC